MNLVLIGVMGCGKSTIGRLLARRLKMRYVDMDKEIVKRHGPIVGIFEKHGEEAFRDIETALAMELSEMDGIVVSTGGGIVKRPENLVALRRNGKVFFLDRPIEEIQKTLKVERRPLLKEHPERLAEIMAEREPLYRSMCDVRVDASSTLGVTLSRIIGTWNRMQGKKS